MFMWSVGALHQDFVTLSYFANRKASVLIGFCIVREPETSNSVVRGCLEERGAKKLVRLTCVEKGLKYQ